MATAASVRAESIPPGCLVISPFRLLLIGQHTSMRLHPNKKGELLCNKYLERARVYHSNSIMNNNQQKWREMEYEADPGMRAAVRPLLLIGHCVRHSY